uniref:Nif11 domain-containing protein n=1 Tax=Steinernema glaseri TaxID=37863 RepID=A0A1I7Z941_9BILA
MADHLRDRQQKISKLQQAAKCEQIEKIVELAWKEGISDEEEIGSIASKWCPGTKVEHVELDDVEFEEVMPEG